MLKTPANHERLPMEVFDKIRAGGAGDRSQYPRRRLAARLEATIGGLFVR